MGCVVVQGEKPPTDNLESPINLKPACFWTVGETKRKLTAAPAEHVNSTQKGSGLDSNPITSCFEVTVTTPITAPLCCPCFLEYFCFQILCAKKLLTYRLTKHSFETILLVLLPQPTCIE